VRLLQQPLFICRCYIRAVLLLLLLPGYLLPNILMICRYVQYAVWLPLLHLPMLLLLLLVLLLVLLYWHSCCWLHYLPMLLLFIGSQQPAVLLQCPFPSIAAMLASCCCSTLIPRLEGICFCAVSAAQGSIWHYEHFCQAT
jgi:hypothetical protein